MNAYLLIKTIHILSSTILFGTGIGIAFFMLQAKLTDSPLIRHHVASRTVLADYFFTLPAVIIQPVSGAWLIREAGFIWTDPWLIYTYLLYGVMGACWIPVVWIQIRLKTLARESWESNLPLAEQYHSLFKWWFALGWPAFLSLIAIFYLMVAKPV